MNVVWFKRDLRTHDHKALSQALLSGPVLPIYILEPDLWQQPDLSQRQFLFLSECIADLKNDLAALNLALVIKVGDALTVLKELRNQHKMNALWSHQETWNHWTDKRDATIRQWAKQQCIPWHEPAQHGVIRRLKDRDGWAKKWYQHMKEPQCSLPNQYQAITHIASDPWPTSQKLGLTDDRCTHRQTGGRGQGLLLLNSFLFERGEHYTKAMSSPLDGWDACSRLSPHIAFGTLSIREIFQRANHRSWSLKNQPPQDRGCWPSAMRSFLGRLRWHCHFIQKLEDEPAIEWQNFHPAYDRLRQEPHRADHLKAWQDGNTGFPMIDACMRSLITTGWLNFRMRAMLMSFASYHLWLDWRITAPYLASLFTDYEPGIHYSQVQMQSGTTGINSIRIYNPIKQGIDQDPEGQFIRQWIPALRDMDTSLIHTPWQAPLELNGYPLPIIDEKSARKKAADCLYGMRKNSHHRLEAKRIVKKHASRKKPRPKPSKPSDQTELPL